MSRNVLGLSSSSSSSHQTLRSNLHATLNPSVNNDSTEQYKIGSTWLNVVTDRLFICTNARANFALWKEIMLDDGRIALLEVKIDQLLEMISSLTDFTLQPEPE
jgi:hypothetical protein